MDSKHLATDALVQIVPYRFEDIVLFLTNIMSLASIFMFFYGRSWVLTPIDHHFRNEA